MNEWCGALQEQAPSCSLAPPTSQACPATPQLQTPWADIWDGCDGWPAGGGGGPPDCGMDSPETSTVVGMGVRGGPASTPLSQDVKAAVEEIDSIISELWRSTPPVCPTQEFVVCSAEEAHDPSDGPPENPEIMPTFADANDNQLSEFAWAENGERVKPSATDLKEGSKRKFKCDKCDKCYNWMSDLAKHQKKHKGKYHKCSECNKSYALKSDLLKHRKSHQVDQAFLCEDCGKPFFSAGDLHKHVRIHTGEKPYFCNICSKSFSASDNFRKHLKVHSGDKPLICPDCGQRFMKKSNLQQHCLIHLGRKPFKCETCGQSFTQKTHLTTHISTHSGLKPYPCARCDQRFTRNADLKRHIGRAHTDRAGNRGL